MATSTAIPPATDSGLTSFLYASEVAEFCRIKPPTLWKFLREGKFLKPFRLGGRPRWVRTELMEWINAGCPDPKTWKRSA